MRRHTDKQQNPYGHWQNPLPPTCRQSRAVLTIRGLFDWHASSKGRKYLSASTTPACFGWGRADDSGDSSLNSHHGCQHQLSHIFINKYAAYKNLVALTLRIRIKDACMILIKYFILIKMLTDRFKKCNVINIYADLQVQLVIYSKWLVNLNPDKLI